MKAALRGLRIATIAVLLIAATISGGVFVSDAHATSVPSGCSTCGYEPWLEEIIELEGGAAASNRTCMRDNGCAGCGSDFCTYDLGDGGTTRCFGDYTEGGGGVCECTPAAVCEAEFETTAAPYWNHAVEIAGETCCQDACFVQQLAQLNYNMGSARDSSTFSSAWPAIQNFCSDPAAAVNAIRSSYYYNPTGRNARFASAWRARAERLIAVIEAGCGNCPAAPADVPPGEPTGSSRPSPVPPVQACTTVIAAPAMPALSSSPCGNCSCTLSQSRRTAQHVIVMHDNTRCFITEQMRFHEAWLFNSAYDSDRFFGGVRDGFFELHILPAMMYMTEQLVTIGMQQMFILGTFFDAKIQLETQQLMQEKAAEAHKDYHPSFEMCVIGTNVRSMAAADRNAEFTSFVLSQRSQDRQLGMYSMNSAKDDSIDREGRIRQVQARYCDPRDNNGDLGLLCTGGKAGGGTINKDVDFARTVDNVRTLNLDFTEPAETEDEVAVLALANNLFSHEVLTKPEESVMDLEAAEGTYLELRSLVAKRSVIENSFNSIVAMKAAGTAISEQTVEFTNKVLEQFGITDLNERYVLLNGTLDSGIVSANRPSYYAQLEVIAQKIYQDPEFYTGLYDKPTNVARKSAAMQAINLMLERDMYKNELRSEMALSIWLEMELMKYQRELQNRINSMIEKYEEN